MKSKLDLRPFYRILLMVFLIAATIKELCILYLGTVMYSFDAGVAFAFLAFLASHYLYHTQKKLLLG